LPLEGSGASTQPSDLLSARTGTLSREVRDRRVPRPRWSTQDPDLQDPRNATLGGLNILQRRPRRLLGLAGCRRDLRKTTDDIQDDCHARRHAPQCTFYSVRPLHPRDSGEDDDFHVPPLMYTAPPYDYKRRRRASFKGDGHPHSRSSSSLSTTEYSPQPTPLLVETSELPSISRLACKITPGAR